jgi:hypothetical protein
MSVAYVQTLAQWSANGAPAISGSFTPTAGDTLLVYSLDGSANTEVFSYSGTGSGSWSQFNPPGNMGDVNQNTASCGFNLLCGGGSQTITTDSTPNHQSTNWGFEYSGVISASASGTTQSNPGTTISGTPVTVGVGSILLAICFDSSTVGATLSMSASPSGTNRGLGVTTFYQLSYCITEYAGAGGSITPTFITSIGTDVFDMMQILMVGGAGGNISGPLPKQVFVMP